MRGRVSVWTTITAIDTLPSSSLRSKSSTCLDISGRVPSSLPTMRHAESLSQLPPWAQELKKRADAEVEAELREPTPANDPLSAEGHIVSTFENLHLADARETQPLPDEYDALLRTRPEAAFEKWKSLYHARTRCGLNSELEACTLALYKVFSSSDTDSANVVIVDKLVRAGIGSFYTEVISESDFFDENPVGVTYNHCNIY